jgi:hypothetical protein
MLPLQSSKSRLRSQDMPPSCSASSAVVFVRRPVPDPYDCPAEAQEEEEDGKTEKHIQLYNSVE